MVAPIVVAAGIIARYGAKKLAKALVKRKIKKENRKYGDPELNAKGNQVMSKASKAHSKNSPDNHDFPSGIIKETLPKKFFKKPMKPNKSSPFDDGFAAGEKAARKKGIKFSSKPPLTLGRNSKIPDIVTKFDNKGPLWSATKGNKPSK